MPFNEFDPSEDDFRKLRQHYFDLWQKPRQTWEVVQNYIEQTFAVWSDREKQASRTNYRSPRANNIINHAVNAQTAYAPRTHREPLGSGSNQRRDADELEKGVNEALIATGKKKPIISWKQLYRFLFSYDYGVARVGADLKDWDALEPKSGDFSDNSMFELRHRQWEREKLHYNPLTIDVPHPSRVLLDPNEKNPPLGIQTFQMEAWKVNELVITKKGQGKVTTDKLDAAGDPYRQVEIDDFWSREWHKVFHKGDLIYAEENTWGFVPFFHTFGGHGAEGSGVEGMRPEHFSRPILIPTIDILLLQTQQMNARHEVLMRAAYALLRSSQDGDQLAEAMRKGNIVEGTDSDDVGYIPFPQLPGWLFQEASEIERDIQEATYPSGVFGVKQPGVVTVGQEAILQERADNTFNDTRVQVEDIATHVAQSFLRLVDVLTFGGHISKEGIRFAKHRIKASQIAQDYNANVTFELVDPILLAQEKQLALAEVAQGLMSRRRYWLTSRVENVTEEEENLLEDEIDKNPQVHSFHVEKILRRKGLKELADEIKAKRDEGDNDVGGIGEPEDLMEGLADMGGGQEQATTPGGGAQAARQIANGVREPIGDVFGSAAKPPLMGR